MQPSVAIRPQLRSDPISVLSRTIDAAIAAALDAAPAARLPDLRLTGDLQLISRSLDDALKATGLAPCWLADWLTGDVLFLTRLFQNWVGAARFLIRLETVIDDACERFHTDNVRFRLVSTYRGPGTEWIPPNEAALAPAGLPLPINCIRRLERGDVAVMRGARGATADRPALLHRSPPIAGSGVTRLLLAIDDAADHQH
jgi:hypothetical protein